MAGSRRVVVWMNPDQAELVRAVARAAEFDLVGVGSPSRGHAGSLAAAFAIPALDDLRAALSSAECDLVWIAAPGSFGAMTGDDESAAVRAAHVRGVKIATLEPIPGSALDLRSESWLGGGEPRPLDLIRFCPLTRLPILQAADLLDSFGPIGTISVQFWGGPGEGTLGARLFGAFDLVHALMGEPETIEAAYVAPGPGRAVHALPGETLRDLHGDAACTLRFADGRAAGVVASDRAGAWSRTITLIGPAGRVQIGDDGFEWINPAGERIDQSPPRPQGDGRPGAVTAFAGTLSRMLSASEPAPPPTDHATILAMAQAALLSCRTGQGESPSTIKRMVGEP